MHIKRRTCVLGLAAGAASSIFAKSGPNCLAQTAARPNSSNDPSAQGPISAAVASYCRQLAREDGGYAWDDQPIAHLTATYAVIGCAQLLGLELPERQRLIDFVREHHPARWKKLEQEHREFELQQIQSLIWLEAEPGELRELVDRWRTPVPYLRQYERDGIPVFRHQAAIITARRLLGLPVADIDPSLIDYVQERRRKNGSFQNTPARDGTDGHVLNTLWGLEALLGLERSLGQRSETIRWLQACQRPDGGFTWQPAPPLGDVTNVTYTWGAIAALALLEARPADVPAAIDFLLRHRNEDGGFADRAGWQSNPLATYYTIDALARLAPNGLADLGRQTASVKENASRSAAGARAALPEGMKVFSLQIEAHGAGSPTDAVRLAKSLRIDMWGAKNPKPGWIEEAQAIARREGADVQFFVANEEYGTWMQIPGFGTYSHMSDIIAPDEAAAEGSLASNAPLTWDEFHRRRVLPLTKSGGRMVWQFGENEELVRVLLDQSLDEQGFSMISTFHFGNPDFTNTEPFLNHYRGRLPMVALQDAHGPEPWWFSDMTSGFRTLFLAREASWESWLEALENRWTVAVRRDEVSHGKLLHHAGSADVLRYVLERGQQWQWWDNPRIARPMLSLVAVRPEDRWETGKPERGINLRLRCAWTNTPQGQPKEPLAEFVSLRVDGQPVEPVKQTLIGGRNPKLPRDEFYLWSMPEANAQSHVAEATVRILATGQSESQTIRF